MRYVVVTLLLTVVVSTLALSQTTDKKPKQNGAVAIKHAPTQHGSGLVLQSEQGTRLRVPGGERSLRMRDRDLHIVISPERSLRKPVANTKVKKLVLINKTASLPPFSESLNFHHRTAYGDVFDSGTLKDYIGRVGSGLKYHLERHGFSLVDPDAAQNDDVLVLEWNVTSVAVYGWLLSLEDGSTTFINPYILNMVAEARFLSKDGEAGLMRFEGHAIGESLTKSIANYAKKHFLGVPKGK